MIDTPGEGRAAPAEASPADADALAAFEGERRRLFAIAYRMLGSARDAEDLLQEAWLRWQGADRTRVTNPPAYLVRLVTRLAIDALRAARARRTEYVGVWLPEPLVEDVVEHPAGAVEMQELADELSTAFLVMLERLTPVERAVFLLRESFDYPFRDIARVVRRTEEHCRQIERRARQRLLRDGPPRPADPAQHRRLLERFLGAVREGDLPGLLAVLSEDAVSYSDGGGKVTAARRPIEGADRVARLFLGLMAKAPADVSFRFARVNGSTGLLTLVGGRLRNVITIESDGDRITRFYIVVNPEKLPAAREPADLA